MNDSPVVRMRIRGQEGNAAKYLNTLQHCLQEGTVAFRLLA